MAKVETKDSPSEDTDIRYRYIGFDVFGKKVKPFFKSDDEKKHYERQVAEYSKTHTAPMRSGTAVKANLLPLVDKVVLTISSIGLIVGSLMPWFSVSSVYGNLNITGVTAFSGVAGFMDIMELFSPMLPLVVYLFSALAIVSLIFGVLTLIMLYLPSKGNGSGLAKLKFVLSWQYIPIVVWVGLFIYLIVGVKIPFGDELSAIYMIRGLGSSFNIVTFWTFAQPALWITFAGLIINAVKSNEL
jgi:hypothetical protein